MIKLILRWPGKSILVLFLAFAAIPLNSQTSSQEEYPQFLFPDFSSGTMKMKNGKTRDVLLNYNTITEKMVYRQGENFYDMITIDIDTVFVEQRKFIPSGKFFYELLVDSSVALFIQHKGKLIPRGAPAAYGGTSQVSSSTYLSSVSLSGAQINLKLPDFYIVQPEPVFWIRNGSDMLSFFNKKQFMEIFTGHEQELNKFIKKNRIKFDSISDMVRLTRFTNELIK